MSIPIKYSLKVAQSVLSLIDTLLDGYENNDRFHVECYSNGREQGYHIRGYVASAKSGFGCSFSEGRISDDIVVYIGKAEDFDPQGNVPSEEIYRDNQVFFRYDKHYQVARLIVDSMKGYVTSGVAKVVQT